MESHPQNSAVSPPGVSVIIPAYNYAHYLPFALNSVLRQDYPVIEIIVVDDGSKDNCAEVVARYGDRVRYIHQENAGLSAARNTGIRAATHPFIAFLDADDIWRPGMLTRIMETFSRLPEEFALVACQSIAVDPSGIPLQDKRLSKSFFGELTARDIILMSRFYPSGAVVRKSVFDECGFFDTTLRSSEDRDMWIRVAAKRRIHLIKHPMVLIRKHETNMSRNADRMKRNMGIVISKARQSGVAGQENALFWRRVNSVYCYQTAWMYHDEARQGAALRDLLSSLLSWPFWWNPHRLNENLLFRVRTGATFLRAGAGNWLKPRAAPRLPGPADRDVSPATSPARIEVKESQVAGTPGLSRNDAVEMGSATVPVAPVGVSPTGPRRTNCEPNGAPLQRGEVSGGTPETAGETPRAPRRTESFRLRHADPPPCIEKDEGNDVRPLTRPAGTLSPSEGERDGVRGISNGSGQFHDAGALSLLPAVSVVITAYNYATVLPAAIRSVLAQDYPLVETIVVDDGSTDSTREVVASLGDRVRYIHQENAGVSAARNAGIREASHPFVAFLDADDEWLPGMLTTIMQAFSTLPPEFGMVACSSQKVNSEGKRSQKTTLTTKAAREVTAAELVLMNQFAADAVVARREMLGKSGLFDTTLTGSEDRDAWIRMANQCRIYFLPDPLVIVRVHPGSASTNATRMKLNMQRVIGKARRSKAAPRWHLFFWAKAYAFYHYQAAWMYMDSGRPGIASIEVLKSLVLWPFLLRADDFHEKPLFRVRSLLDFCSRMLWKKE